MPSFILQCDPVSLVEKSTVRHACALADDLRIDAEHASQRGAMFIGALSGVAFGHFGSARDLCPVGTVEFCRAWMHATGVIEPRPIDYPVSLWPSLGRSLCCVPFEHAPDGAWIKPVRTKAWEAHIKQPGETAPGPGKVWASPVLADIVAEWRVYVADGKIAGHGRYDDGDDDALVYSAADVEAWVRAYQDSGEDPAGYALDVALLKDGRTVLVEVTDGWAIGYYKGTCSPVAYARLLAARWAQIRAQSESVLAHTVAEHWPAGGRVDHPPMLHVYAQFCNHDDAHILGTRTGLMLLRQAIDRVLAQGGVSDAANLFAADGEGYDVRVACVSEEDLEAAKLPYSQPDDFGQPGLSPDVVASVAAKQSCVPQS